MHGVVENGKLLTYTIKERILEAKTDYSAKDRMFSASFALKYAFPCEKAWHLPDSATPLSFWFQIAEIMSFLLMYRLFLYYLWFFQNIEKGWRKNIFNFRHFEKSRK